MRGGHILLWLYVKLCLVSTLCFSDNTYMLSCVPRLCIRVVEVKSNISHFSAMCFRCTHVSYIDRYIFLFTYLISSLAASKKMNVMA